MRTGDSIQLHDKEARAVRFNVGQFIPAHDVYEIELAPGQTWAGGDPPRYAWRWDENDSIHTSHLLSFRP